MNTGNKNISKADNGGSKPKHNSQDELDNDTYGHNNEHDVFKRKNMPKHEVDEETDASTKLKDLNILEGDDVAQRNKLSEKGIGGKE